MKIYIRAFLFLAAITMFSSCIGFNRQIKLNSDGSGSEKVTLSLNKNVIIAMQMQLSVFGNDTASHNEDLREIEELFKDTMYLAEFRNEIQKICKTDNLELKSVKEKSSTDSTKIIEIYYKFDNVENLISEKVSMLPGDDMPDGLIKKISPVKFTKGKNYSEFSYKLGKNSETDTLQQYDSLKVSDDKITEMVFGNGTFTIEVRTENKIISTNADNWSGKKAKWVIPMIDYIRKVKNLYLKFSR
jgi:hypothetical protein